MISKQLPPLPEILNAEKGLTAEQRIELARMGKTIVQLQENPDIALVALSGITVPPHQRLMLYLAHWGAPSNVFIASRGTAKTSTIGTLYANYKQLLFPRRNAVTLAAKGFRGGQMMFLDTEKWIQGGWDSQDLQAPFFRGSIDRQNLITKAANYWTIQYDSFSKNVTLPTKDPEAIRGWRGNDLFMDEANFVDLELIDKVVMPFLNVKGDFKHGGAFAASNQIYFITTVDYNWRAFQNRITAARDGIYRDWQATQAAQAGEWEKYEHLEVQGLYEHSHIRLDYTDILIRRRITNRAGRTFEVQYPDPNIPLTVDKRGIPFTEKDEQGRMKKFGSRIEYYQTYPVDKESMERSLLDGSTDEGSWLSEQRNVIDTATGDVYAHELVDKAACVGERHLLAYADLPEGWKKRFAEEQLDYMPPVLWRCTDPCVLGVDWAPQSDFCAFVVIRMGPLAKGAFDPFTHCGKTPWSNVIWAEQHQKLSAEEGAEKIRQLAERYNLLWFDEPHVTDPWKICRAIGLDMRGGGSAVRDELCFMSHEVIPPNQFRIFDPADKDDRIRAFANDKAAKPMLDSIWPTDQLNDKLVEFTVGQMQQNLLYIGKYLDVSERPRQRELNIGFEAMRGLAAQLRKLRQAPTKNYRSFYMEGDTAKTQHKKDLWAAFIYAAKEARAHIIRQRQIDETPPPMGARVVRINSGRGGWYGRTPGSRD